MESYFRKTILQTCFETLIDELVSRLETGGFVLCGVTDYQDMVLNKLQMHFRKYKVLAIESLEHAHALVSLSSVEGIVLPCSVTVAELYPGRIAVVRVNPTALIARELQQDELKNVSDEVTRKLDLLIGSLGHQPSTIPDLVTSWA
ncbi:MAG TPA: DUF302 domain-containing protein [Chryseosolibacter sp.]